MNTTSHASQECLSDSQFFRLWNQDAEPGERETFGQHLSSCPSCRGRWEEYSRDADLAVVLLQHAKDSPAGPSQPCYSEEQIAEYVSGVMTPEATKAIDEHLTTCHICAAIVRSVRFFCWQAQQQAEKRATAPKARPALRLVTNDVKIGELVRSLLPSRPPEEPLLFEESVNLACLTPKATAALRLAAATGEGLSEQVFRQDKPPFEIQLTQFGQELRIEARVLEAESPYRTCLAELKLLEGDQCRLSRIILIQDGRGRCIVEPSAVDRVQPDKQPVRLSIQPLVTAEQLNAVGPRAFLPILERLLEQDDAEVRASAVQLLGQMPVPKIPAASQLLKRACRDANPRVRSLAQSLLHRTQGES